MKNLLLFISFFVSLIANSQTIPIQTIGNPNNKVKTWIFEASKGVQLGNWVDTTAANLDTWVKFQPGIKIRTGDIEWVRSADLTHWFRSGAGAVIVDTTTSILLSGDGSPPNPLSASLVVSQQNGNAVQVLSDGVYIPTFVVDGLNSGGVVTWVSGYTYDVSAAQYAIGGIAYTSPYTQVTLQNSDPTFDRIDAVVANNDGTVTVIEGDPADDPLQPNIDESTQVQLAFILVTANSIEPVVEQDYLYLNNAEWTTASSTARINPASTNNPFSPTLDIEGTLVQNGDNIRFTAPSPPTMSLYNILTLKIFSKAVWVNTSKITLQWYDETATATGLSVNIANNQYSFQSTQTSSYQTVSIPLTDFGALVDPTNLLMTIVTQSGATIGFYIDNIQLQESFVPTGNNSYINNQSAVLQPATFKISGSGFLGGTGGDAGFGLNRDPLGTTTMVVQQRTSSNLQDPIFGIFNKSNQNIMVVSGNGLLTLNSGGSSTGFNIVGGANSGAIRVTPSNSPSVENLIAFYPLTNITKTQQTVSIVNIGSLTGLTPTGLFAPTSGTANFIALGVVPTINQTGSASGTIYGVRYNPLMTSVLGTHYSFYADAGKAFITDETMIGSNTDNGDFRLQVTGGVRLDATSKTIALVGLSTDNTATQVAAKDGSGNTVWRDVSSIVSGSGNTLQQVITNGATLTGNNTIAGGGFNYSMTNSHVSLNSPGGSYFTLEDGGGDMVFSGQAGDIRLSTTGTGNFIHIHVGTAALQISGDTETDDIFINPNMRLELGTSASDLATPVNGQMYYNSATNKFRAYENGSWTNMITAGGSPMTNPMTATGDIIYSSDGSGTPAALPVATNGDVLTLVGGLPVWVTPGVGGSVTSVGLTSSDITVGGATSPITTSGTYTLTLATVNGNVGTFGSATQAGVFTVNAKGLITAASNVTITPAASSITGGAALTKTDDTNVTLTLGGTPATSLLAATSLTLGWTGVLSEARGGTSESTYALGDILWASATNTLSKLPMGTAGQLLRVNAGATALEWAAPSAAGVSAIIGTANQVLANGTSGSSQTGAVTLTLPQSIHTAATPTFGSMTLSGSGATYGLYLSSANTNSFVGIFNASTINATAGQIAALYESTGTIVEAGSSNHSLLTAAYFDIPTVTPGAATVTNAATVFIAGEMSATVSGASDALWIGAGSVRITPLAAAGRYITSDATGTLTLGFNRTVQTLTDGATITWNVSNGGNGQVTLAGTGRILTITNPVAGETYTIEITQGSGGSKTITTWPTNTTFSGSNTLSTVAGDVDIVVFYYNGSGFRAVMTNDYD